MTKNMYKSIMELLNKKAVMLLLLVCLFGINESRASHATGADLTYTSLGNGQYLVTFTFFRDCFGIPAPTTQTLSVQSFTCNFNQTYTMNATPGTGYEITHPCSTSQTTCTGGSVTGIQLWEYSVVVTLPAQCIDWNFNVSVSARNAAVTTIVNPDFNNLYVDAFLDNTNGDNNSPTFTNVPIAFECIGQVNNFNHGVIDADGDSLVYSFIVPRSDANSPLQYVSGYSVANPLTSVPPVSIDPISGDITMTPTQPEVASVAVLIQEYRNGVLIGTIMRDMQIYIVPCSNTLPLASGIDTTTNFVTSTCIGSQLCFNIVSSDPDPLDTLTMTANTTAIPAATFSTTTSTRPVGTFCWTPTAADARPQPYTFTVTVRDNACPSNGTQTFVYSITVSNMAMTFTSTPSVQCFNSHNGSASVTASGNPPLQYIWTLDETPPLVITGVSSVNHLGPGNHVLNVIDNTGCVGVQNFTILAPPPLTVTLTPVSSGCGGALGMAIASASGGTPPYSYSWNTTPVQTSDTATGLHTGTYTCNVVDSSGCSVSDSVFVSAVTNVDFTIHSTPATCLANDGTVSVTHTGGVGPYSYHWSNITDTTVSSQNGLITGSYNVTAIDLGTGCSEYLTTIVQNAAGLNATITSSTDASCGLSEDGSATVVASGGQPPYYYLWPNGDTTATTNHLAAGTHLVRVEDYNGCLAYASVTIGFINPAPVVELGPDTMPCIGSPYTMDAGPGGASYLWSDGSSMQTLTLNNNTSGLYSVIVTNSFGCQSFDAINVTFVTCLIHPSQGSALTSNTLASASLRIYPNPVKDVVNVSVSKISETQVTVTLLDILGNKLFFNSEFAQNGYSKKVDIRSLPVGIYTMKVEYNGEVNTVKIIKQ